ncbi:MAG: hypothetical protein V7721_11635 [Porticoccaceae bacterium]
MIDRNARNAVAEAARHYVTGLSTNFTFDEALFNLKFKDQAIEPICQNLWLIYDDLREHKHEGLWRLSEEQREIVIRIIMFLKSNIEYRWPTVPTWYSSMRPLIWLFTFSLGAKVLDQKFEFIDNENVWPFRDSNEVQEAKDDPKYLAAAT